jgi:uncharacterized protein YqeY
MTLLAEIKLDQTQARKARDASRVAILTTLLAEAATPGLNDGKRESTNDEVIAVLKKFVKNLNEVISAAGDSPERSAEKSIYESYLPSQIGNEELGAMIDVIIESSDGINMGLIMKELKASGANYDGKAASQIAKVKLS